MTELELAIEALDTAIAMWQVPEVYADELLRLTMERDIVLKCRKVVAAYRRERE